eukprot:s2849_g3.t1
MASVGWVITLTFILLYSASLVFTTLVGRGYIYADPTEIPEEATENFGSVWRSFLALFKLMNDDQSVVEKIISTVGGQILFYAFMMLSNWMMLAILTSVISDNMMSVSREEDRKKALCDKQEHAKRQITKIFQKLDEDESGSISEQEMMKLLGDPELKMELCEAAGLDAADLVEMLHCASYKTKSEGSDESATARERSIFKVLENMRAMEFRLENRLNAALQKLEVTDKELHNLPSLTHELEKTRGLEDSPARHLVNQLLPRSETCGCGSECSQAEGGSAPSRRAPRVLVVREIAPEGLLTMWNRAHPGNEVLAYDRIYAVNGKTRIEEMQQELRKSHSVALRFVRYPQMFAVELRADAGGPKPIGLRIERTSGPAAELRIEEVLTDGAMEQFNLAQIRRTWRLADGVLAAIPELKHVIEMPQAADGCTIEKCNQPTANGMAPA